MEGSFCHGMTPSSVRCSQLPFVAVMAACDESSVWKSHSHPG